ncbi:hypothetical protein V8E54_013216 [Elaphomyces granulatus]
MPAIGRKKECPEELNSPIADLEEKLRSKAPDLTGQNATRHQAVLRFPHCQKTQSLALQVARCFNRGRWFAYELELSWKKTGRFQPENKGGETMIVDDFEALKVAVPETSVSVTEASIRGFYKLALYVPSMLILQVSIWNRGI